MYKHRLKQFVYEGNVRRPKIVHVNSYYGSDVLDKHGNEIFEGDRVKLLADGIHMLKGSIVTVTFENGMFLADGEEPLEHFGGELEVIGHVAD